LQKDHTRRKFSGSLLSGEGSLTKKDYSSSTQVIAVLARSASADLGPRGGGNAWQPVALPFGNAKVSVLGGVAFRPDGFESDQVRHRGGDPLLGGCALDVAHAEALYAGKTRCLVAPCNAFPIPFDDGTNHDSAAADYDQVQGMQSRPEQPGPKMPLMRLPG